MRDPHQVTASPGNVDPATTTTGEDERSQTGGHNWTATHHAGLDFALYNTADSLVILSKRAVAGHILERKGRCEGEDGFSQSRAGKASTMVMDKEGLRPLSE